MAEDEDLVQKCKECESCPIEMMLTIEQRYQSVLNQPFPEKHIHREVIEQICGRHYDLPCEMKYLFMRLSCNDRAAVQNANIAMSLWDLGKKFQRPVEFPEGATIWAQEVNLGRGITESYAKRFEKIWELGIRGKRQGISVMNIYETVIGTPKTYEQGLAHYQNLKNEHFARDKCLLKI